MTKPKAKSGGRWQRTCFAAAGVLYAAVTGGGIGTATYLDATRSAPVAREIVPPREAPVAREEHQGVDARLRGLSRKRPDAPEPLLPPCTADAVPKSDLKPEDPAIEQGTVTAIELNVRQTPAGRIVGQLYRGDKIDILERRANGGGVEWLRTPKGWVAARFVEIDVSIAREEHQGVDGIARADGRQRPDALNGLSRKRPDAPEDLAPTCFPPGPWCPGGS